MAIPTILKGDTPSPISITVPEALARLDVTYQGVMKSFTGVSAASTVQLVYTAADTARFALGTYPIQCVGVYADASRKTFPITAKIKVTDCPGEVYSTPITLEGGEPIRTRPVTEVSDGSTMSDIRDKVNEIARIVSGSATIIIACAMLSGGAKAATRLDMIPGSNTVYTASETDQKISEAVTSAGAVIPSVTTNIATYVTSNLVTKSYVESLGIEAGMTPEQVNAAIKTATNAMEAVETDRQIVRANWLVSFWQTKVYQASQADNALEASHANVADHSTTAESAGTSTTATMAQYNYAMEPLASINDLVGLSQTQSVDHATIAAWESYWGGEDVRVTVTNYDSLVHAPSLYIEYNTNTVSAASPTNNVVWDELTRWNSFMSVYNLFTNNVLNNFADRAWGVYDSSTGAYSPDGLLQISQPEIQIANGLAYKKSITTGGCAVWVLTATEPTTISGVTSNGYFRITDGDGNALFEIVKGDKRTVGATASSIVATNGMTINYNVISDDHPTLELTTDLKGTWYDETECSSFATVSWSGTNGAWVVSVTPVGAQSRMFAKASYEVGGDTYIRNSAPIGFDRIYIGGTNYSVHVEMMNGKKVMVLE